MTPLPALSTGRYALVFPGAGSHLPSMARRLCRAFPVAVEVLERAEKAVGLDLARLCRAGTARELAPPEISHPAVVATALAGSAALRSHLGERLAPPAFIGGHSLGHFAALVAAESIGFEEALVLVARRARLMAEQSRRRPALMASISGVAPARVAEWCADCPAAAGTAVTGCFNGPRQTVVSGDEAAVRWVAARAAETSTEEDHVHIRELTAGVASHSPLMDPVQEELAPALDALGPTAPTVPVLLNTTGRPSTDPDELGADLLRQLSAPVLWNEAMRAVLDSGVETVVDTGPGQVLAKAAALHPAAVPVALNFMQPLEKVVPLP
ncbi:MULTISPECIES: ACP S-malonyltransferase [Streptomyces]|uniref:ACP S-malonyltransferase n=1 Tax=Streptomyces TaxID=1883 RepID=UPI00067DFF13|nr:MULTISPECIES: ACP S-malonyltransferase [Streptomyces]MDX3605484.1 ACP S-malonyltransferase [Streptomyces sp. FL06-04B]MDX3736420.1 ACP S-malonyltransferase [Streptomyces sp. ID01-15D]